MILRQNRAGQPREGEDKALWYASECLDVVAFRLRSGLWFRVAASLPGVSFGVIGRTVCDLRFRAYLGVWGPSVKVYEF